MKCAELVRREGDLVLCGEAATHSAVFDWTNPLGRMPLCLLHSARPPACVKLLDLRPGTLRRVV